MDAYFELLVDCDMISTELYLVWNKMVQHECRTTIGQKSNLKKVKYDLNTKIIT